MSELLNKYLFSKNIANYLETEELDQIAVKVKQGYDIDVRSREDWLARTKEALDLALLVSEKKNFPFENSASVKYPMLATAAIQFASRAYPSIVKGKDVVKGKVVGKPNNEKSAKASRISRHMSYQCLEEMEEWEDQLDTALTALPIVGSSFKKTYFCATRGRIVSEYRSAEHVVINYHAKSLDSAPRVTDVIELYPNEIRERQLAGVFLDIDLGDPTKRINEDAEHDGDEDQAHVFLEQHCLIDLDADGLKEPYIVTVHHDTQRVVRIVARYKGDGIIKRGDTIIRIDPERYFTQYPFMKSPDGGIYGMGFGSILYAMNQTVNSTINQLLDAGTLANSQTGFIGKGLALGRGRGGGNIDFTMGEWKSVQYTGDDLRKNIFPLPVREPSGVLFNLLGFMVEAGEKVSSVSEVLTGDQSIHNEPATTTLARIEQGLKVFSAIYKRVYRGMKSEFKKMFRLNQLYLNPQTYFTVLDEDEQSVVYLQDYNPKEIDVIPVSDPGEVSETQKLLKSEILMSMMGMGLDNNKIIKRRLEALNIEDPEDLMLPEGYEPPPDPKIELDKAKLQLDRDKLAFEMQKWPVEEAEKKSMVIKNLAEAESKDLGPQLEEYKIQMKALIDKEKIDADKQVGLSRMAATPGNKGGKSSNEGTAK